MNPTDYTLAQLETEVMRVLKQECKVDKKLSRDCRLTQDLGLDSVGLLTLSMEVENRYEVILGEDPNDPPRTIGAVVDLLAMRLNTPQDPGNPLYQGDSLNEALEKAAQTNKGVDFYSRKREVSTLPYSKLLLTSSQISFSLRTHHNIQTGDTVAIVMGTSPLMIQSIFGVLLAGAVPCCLPTPRLGNFSDYNASLQTFLKRSQAKAVFTESKLQKTVDPISQICFKRDSLLVSKILEDQTADPQTYIHKSTAQDRCLLQFSSGTTQEPKAVVLSHGNITANTRAIINSFPKPYDQHSGASWLPLHHDMGLIGGLFAAICTQANMTLMKPEDFILRPALWLQMLSDTKATTCPAPNFALQICIDRIRDEELEGVDLSHWKIALIGAEAVKPVTLNLFYNKFKNTGFPYSSFTPVYGLAEGTLAVTFSSIEKEALSIKVNPQELHKGNILLDSNGQQITSVGTPLSGVEIQIRDEQNQILGQDKTGSIYTKGASVMQGYLIDGALVPDGIIDGWLDTGDLGFVHDSELFIYGRKKDIIIMNGRNVDPGLIETGVGNIEGIDLERVAAIPVFDEKKATEGFVVLLEKRKGKIENVSQKIKSINDNIIKNTSLVPTEVLIIETGGLPRTTSGKIKRATTKELFLNNQFKIIKDTP